MTDLALPPLPKFTLADLERPTLKTELHDARKGCDVNNFRDCDLAYAICLRLNQALESLHGASPRMRSQRALVLAQLNVQECMNDSGRRGPRDGIDGLACRNGSNARCRRSNQPNNILLACRRGSIEACEILTNWKRMGGTNSAAATVIRQRLVTCRDAGQKMCRLPEQKALKVLASQELKRQEQAQEPQWTAAGQAKSVADCNNGDIEGCLNLAKDARAAQSDP
jgi:hypothetical protein